MDKKSKSFNWSKYWEKHDTEKSQTTENLILETLHAGDLILEIPLLGVPCDATRATSPIGGCRSKAGFPKK